jgi:beta-1,4-mannosyl-glycoprotein beta-1,4-N-acetylglucosaminyltransferase|tara:strand:+ start:4387 stop:5259 length:873 start_codon:yes stop_codon:yes gene_type:complete
MYYNEDTILDLRLNYLNHFVDHFVIVESTFNHRGEKKKLNFDINKFSNFKKKIKYFILDDQPKNIDKIKNEDTEQEKSVKYILNGYKRDHFQRNYILNGINDADPEDLIIISDIDEIPNLNKINIDAVKNKLIFFNQKMCYYKFNLYQKNYNWTGTKACKKKNLISPQWLRDIKTKKYPIWRLDALFSKKKYSDIYFVKNGGWHFSYLNTPKLIEEKLRSYTHHREYDLNPLGISNIEKKIKNRESIYNLCVDQRKNQFSKGVKLDILNINELPEYIGNNYEKFKEWLED